MPLTGFELFVRDWTVIDDGGGYFRVTAKSGENSVPLRTSRASATELYAMLGQLLADPPEGAEVVELPV